MLRFDFGDSEFDKGTGDQSKSCRMLTSAQSLSQRPNRLAFSPLLGQPGVSLVDTDHEPAHELVTLHIRTHEASRRDAMSRHRVGGVHRCWRVE